MLKRLLPVFLAAAMFPLCGSYSVCAEDAPVAEQTELPEDSRYSIGENHVIFTEPVDTVWILSDANFDDYYRKGSYKFYPDDGARYLVLTSDYNADVKELLSQPDMPGVDCTMQSYVVENNGGSITVTEDKEYLFPYPETEEERQEALNKTEEIFSKTSELTGADHFFQCIRVSEDDGGVFFKRLHISSSAEGSVFVTKDAPADGTETLKILPANTDEETGTKRYAIEGSYRIGDEIVYTPPVTHKIHITKIDGGIMTVYEINETDGILVQSSLKADTFIQGDVSDDENFNVADIVLLQRWLLGKKPENFRNWKAADLNGDDVIDVFDLTAAKKYLVETM